MRRVLLENTYLMAGNTAKSIYEEKPLTGDGLDFIIEKRYLSAGILSTIRDFVETTIGEKGFTYTFEGVPIRFKFVERRYPFFQDPDTKMYHYEVFKLPNPWDEYWKVRGIVR